MVLIYDRSQLRSLDNDYIMGSQLHKLLLPLYDSYLHRNMCTY